MRGSTVALVALCLWASIASGRAQEYCWNDGSCDLRDEAYKLCAPFGNQSACTASNYCDWLPEGGPEDGNGDVPFSQLQGLPWPAAFNLSTAAEICDGSSGNDTCPSACQKYLNQLGTDVVRQVVQAACTLSTCEEGGICWDTNAQASFKHIFHTVAETCTGQTFPSCWPAGGRCAPVDVCDGLEDSACSSATLVDGGDVVCNYTSSYRCEYSNNPDHPGSGGGSSYYDPCRYSQDDPCCTMGRAASFGTCVLDSPPQDSCTFSSSGCQPDYGLCSRQMNPGSCAELAESGCAWTSFSGSPTNSGTPYPQGGMPGPGMPGMPGNGSSAPAPSPSGQPMPRITPGAAPWQIWTVPPLSPSFFNSTNSWWSDPARGGHGPFDLLTPPIADALLQAQAAGPLCQAFSQLLRIADGITEGSCELSGMCDPNAIPALYRVTSQVADSLDTDLNPCELCHGLIDDLLPMLVNETGIDLVRLFAAVGAAGLERFDTACPAMVEGVLWVARHYDFLPGPGQPVASAVCPALRAVVAAAPDLATNIPSTCALFGSAQGCAETMSTLLTAFNASEPGAAAQALCYAKLPELFMPRYDEHYDGNQSHGEQQYNSTQSFGGQQYNRQQYINEGPNYGGNGGSMQSGYCMMSGNAMSQCYAPDSASCTTVPGCLWTSSCYQQRCSEGDCWCQQRNDALPICGPLVKLLLPAGGNSDAPVPLAEVCGRMGMCSGSNNTNSALCSACKTAMSEAVSSIKYQQQYSNSYNWGWSTEEMAFSMCSNTLARLSDMKAQCGAFAALSPASLAAANATRLCEAQAATLCQPTLNGTTNCTNCTLLLSAYQELSAAGVYSDGTGLAELCYTAYQWGGGNLNDSLHWQLQWRYGCDPSSACCAALPSDSFLNASIGLGGLTPQTTSRCEELPGCTADTYCWPAWGADTCQSLSAASCKENRQCQWYAWSTDNEQGSCVDAALSAKCRLAGQQGGKAGCAAVRDDQGLSQCTHNQACHLDWSVRQCDNATACCLQPADLFQPQAPQACSNGTTDNAVCDYTTQCQTRFDSCNSFISKSTCELGTSCAWRSSQVPGYPAYGWCQSVRDACYEYNNDPEACASSPQCRSVPRCDVSYCAPDDSCCLIHSPAQCSATPGCATSGWCGLVSSDCWMAWDGAACNNLPGCNWQTYNYTTVEGSTATAGWCAVASDPCSPHYNSPVACASVREPQRNLPICRYSSACYDACASCGDCLDGVSRFIGTVLPGLNGTLPAQAVRDFCYQSGGDYWTCFQAYRVAAAHPESVQRPAAMCKALGMCSPQCMSSLGLVACSTDGSQAGAVAAQDAPNGVCKSSSSCSSGQSCDTASCTVLTQCDAETGLDSKSCGGTCVSACSLLEPLLTKLNRGTCSTDGDCNTNNGETCAPVAGRTCRRSLCNTNTGAVSTEQCAGFCSLAGAPALVSAALSTDGRQVLLSFDQEVAVASSLPSGILAPATVGALGQFSQVYSDATDLKTLVVYLGWDATVAPGGAVTVANSPTASSRLTGTLVGGGTTVLLQAPASPVAPTALLSGPASVGSGCGQAGAAGVVLDASRTPFSAGRPVTFAWEVTAAASQRTALDQLAAAASASSSQRLVLPSNTVASMAAGSYTVRLTARNWLGANASTTFTFAKSAAELPLVAVIGGSEQDFSVATGIRIQTAIDLSSVCPGKRVTYLWNETSGLLLPGSFAATRNTLVVRGPVTGVTGGSVLNFSFSATLEDAGTTTTSLTLTARQSQVLAVLSGPQGDVLDTRTLTFSGSGSLDPDDAANTLQPFRFSWTCTATDPATQLSIPCFSDPATAPDQTASQLVIPPGLLPAGSSLYQIGVAAAKGSGGGTRSDTDTTTLRVLAGAAPTGRITRFCPGYSGCASKQHTPSEPLRLVFSLDDPSLLTRTTFAWTSPTLSLATAASTSKQSLVVQPFMAAGARVFADGAQAVVTVIATADGKNATTSITVAMARRPTCTAAAGASCLSVSPSSGPVDSTAFTATASGFAADSTLTYDFGVQLPGGKVATHVRGSVDARFTFAPRVLAEGVNTIIVCAKDVGGAQACSTSNVTVQAPAQAVTAAAINALGDSLNTALASGSTDALLSVVRQLSAATSTASGGEGGEEAQAAATEQAEQAMGAMEDLLSEDGATAEEVLGVADAAFTLVDASPELSPTLADSALNVAASALAALSNGAPVQASDLDGLLDIVGACGPALLNTTGAGTGEGGLRRRRHLLAEQDASLAEQALDALTRTFAVVSGVQSTLLASMVAGESASVGSAGLVATAALADFAGLNAAANYGIGASGAGVTLLAGFAELVESEEPSFQLMLSHQEDASLLLTLISASSAEVPAPDTPARRRSLLTADAPEVAGSLATTVVSGYVNFTSSLDGLGTLAGQAIAVTLPLNDAFDAGLDAMCLRLDSSGYWRSDAVQLTSAAGGSARCVLSNVNNQQVVVVTYTMPEGEGPEGAAPGSPPPGSSPSPDAEEGDDELVTVTVPQIFFTARLTAYSPGNFTLGVQQQYIAALQAGSPHVDTLVVLTNIRAGSVIVDTTIQFLVSNGNTAAADQLAAILSTDPASLLPPGVWGEVTVSNLVQSAVTITVPEGLLSAPAGQTSFNRTALIAGLVGGIGGAILLAGAAICVWKQRAAKKTVDASSAQLESQFIEGEAGTPLSPTPFLNQNNSQSSPFAASAPRA